MYGNMIFVGGIHGVGKSTLCIETSKKLGIEYLSASDVLKWREIKADYKDKNVEDIGFTQDKLVIGLKAIVQPNKQYLLDGHCCLFNAVGEVNAVPLETFTQINPISICNIIGDPSEIAARLNERDGKNYEAKTLTLMQDQERSHGQAISKSMNILYSEFSNQEFAFFFHTISKTLSK